ncbi:MAG TPA: class I tRNA ligase family protein, partial [Kiritimatiellia bacterium]|nr:class I tRNA ligase family protein [Kiritimatiellia bacterium]
SWLWPFSVFGWPEKGADLSFYYPTVTLSTASEIIFFWVARMIMAGFEFMGDIPFREVYIHGTVRDESGLKMSKSLGNSIDPLAITEQFSADALRFSLIMLTATGQDVFLSNSKFEIGRNFGTKLWNAARFIQMQAKGAAASDAPAFDAATLSADDRHILAKLHAAIAACNDNLARYRLNDYAKTMYEFLWHQFCDWYVEYAKQILYGADEKRKADVLAVMHYVFSRALRLLHPLMPFLTEELWHGMGYAALHGDSYIMTEKWPEPRPEEELQGWGITPELVSYVDARHDLVRIGRTLRADYGIPPGAKVKFTVRPVSPVVGGQLESDREAIVSLLKAETLTLDPAFTPVGAMPGGLSPLGTIFLSLEGLVDPAKEVEKLNGQIAETEDGLQKLAKKLDNLDFVTRAPATVIEQHKARKAELVEKLEKLRKLRDTLKPA